MTRNEVFETTVLDDLGDGASFTNDYLKATYGFTGREATDAIDKYQRAMRRGKGRYVLHRTGRTTSAVWHIGVRTQDARIVVGQFGSDTLQRVTRAIEPDLRRIGELNPRALPKIKSAMEPLVAGLANMLEAMMAAAGIGAD